MATTTNERKDRKAYSIGVRGNRLGLATGSARGHFWGMAAKKRWHRPLPVPSGDPPDGKGAALFLPAETGSPSPPRSAQPGW